MMTFNVGDRVSYDHDSRAYARLRGSEGIVVATHFNESDGGYFDHDYYTYTIVWDDPDLLKKLGLFPQPGDEPKRFHPHVLKKISLTYSPTQVGDRDDDV